MSNPLPKEKKFYEKIYKLIDSENLKEIWNNYDHIDICELAIKAAVYYALNDGMASFSDIENMVKRSIKSWRKESHWDEEDK